MSTQPSEKPANLHRKGTKTVLRPQDVEAGTKLPDLYSNEQTYLRAVGERIRKRRVEVGFGDQQALGEALGSTQSYASRIETGNGLALLITLINLSNALDCSLDYIALRTDDPHPYFPDEIDNLTILYQPENAHQRAVLVRLLNLVHAMPPDHQLLLLRTAESMADTANPGSVQAVIYPADEEPARVKVGAEAVSIP
jgi:transcriptional regulator with XRE-family HTH domain